MQRAKYIAWKPTCSYLILPKCGNSSVREAIMQQMGIRWPVQDFVPRYQSAGPVGFSFTLLRHPVDRALSTWWDKTQLQGRNWQAVHAQLQEIWGHYGRRFWVGMPLAAFVDALESIDQPEDHFAPYADLLKREGMPHFVGELGNREHWRAIQCKTQLPPLKRFNASRNRPTAANIDHGLRTRLDRYYLADLNTFYRLLRT